MAATQLRRVDRDVQETEPAPMADSIGGFGWLSLFTLALIVFTLVSNF